MGDTIERIEELEQATRETNDRIRKLEKRMDDHAGVVLEETDHQSWIIDCSECCHSARLFQFDQYGFAKPKVCPFCASVDFGSYPCDAKGDPIYAEGKDV